MGATARRLRRPVTDQTGVGGTAPRARACPGQLSAGRVFVRDSAGTCTNSYGWALPWSVHGCIAPRRHSPNRRRSAVPGPRPVAPHAVPGGPGHLPHGFHISVSRWRILAPMAATAVHVRSPAPARARRLLRVGDDRLVARVRAGDDDAFEIIYDRYYRGLLAFCGHMLGSRQEAEDALQHSFASAYRALRGGQRRHRAAPVAVHDRAQPLPVGPARAPRARSPSTRSRTAPGRSRAWRPRSSGATTCASWWTSCSACPTTSAPRWSSSSSATSPTSRSRPCSACAARRSRRSSSRRARRCCAHATARADTVRRDPRAARHRSPAACRARSIAAQRTSTAVPAARSSSARCAASGRRSRRSCRWCRPSA